MKILSVLFGLAVAFAVPVFAQGTPPLVVTNIVALTPTTRLSWNPETNSVGYRATMKELSPSTNQWSLFTTNTTVTLVALNPSVQTGTYLFEVRGVNKFGLEGPAGTVTTNVSTLPTIIVNVRVEVTLP